MAGIGKVIKDLEEEVVDYVEEEVDKVEEEFEGKTKYPEKFKGDVLGKSDPYEGDLEDHSAHEVESEVPDPEGDAQWFPATKGISAKQNSNDSSDQSQQKQDKKSGKVTQNKADDGKQKDGDAKSLSPISGGKASSAKQSQQKSKQETADQGAVEDIDSPTSSDTDRRPATEADKQSSQGDLEDEASEEEAASNNLSKNTEDGGDGFQLPSQEQRKNTLSSGENSSSDIAGEEQDPEPDSNLSKVAREDVTERAGAAKAAAASQDYEREVFRKKAPSLKADLRDLAQKGKKAKEKKEILRGVRRTLEEPHKLFKDPHRLSAARSGNHHKLITSLKRHGRSIMPVDDPDPEDISANPHKLKEVRRNHRVAMRHMIDMGNQYGMDPFEGVDPQDIEEIIEHHASKHPHRRDKIPYHHYKKKRREALKRYSDENKPDNSDDEISLDNSGDEDSLDNNDGVLLDESADAGESDNDGNTENLRPRRDEEESGGDDKDDGENDENDNEETYIEYPKLDESDRFTPNSFQGGARRHKLKRKKRKYPKPYEDDENPGDLQLAADSLEEMAGEAAEMNGDDEGDENDESLPIHKKRALAARKMLRCLNRVRSFQEDPKSCEAAFVDEATESGCEVDGLAPEEIETQYYSLKKVHAHYKKRKHKKHNSDASNSNEETRNNHPHHHLKHHRGIEHENRLKHRHHHHHHHRKSEEYTYTNYDQDSFQEAGFQSNYSSYNDNPSPDIEMNLPENQFPDTTVSGNMVAGDYYSDPSSSGDPSTDGNSDPNSDDDSKNGGWLSQIGDVVSSFFGDDDENAEGEVEGAVEGVESVVGEAEGAVEGVETAVGEAEQAVEGVESAVGEVEGAVEGVESAVGEAEQAAESVEGVVGEVSKVEGELSEVEKVGSEAEQAAAGIEEMENAEGEFASMLNLCANPADNLTKGNNVLSGIAQLAEHPDDVINQAESLINVGKQGIEALASAKSPSDAFGAIMGMVSQLSGGDQDDGSGGSDTDDSASSQPDDEQQPNDQQQGYYPNVAYQGASAEEGYPEEFANIDSYGD